MKMTKKKVFVVAIAVCLIAVLSMSTLAWFSASDDVTNKFYVADSETDADEIFSVDVWEYVNGEQTKDDDGAEFTNIYPSARYHKEPYVENTGKYDQWIRVKVTVTDANAWIALFNQYGFKLADLFEGHDEAAWDREFDEGYDSAANTYTATYYLNYKLEPGKTAGIFNTVVIPEEFTQEDLAQFKGGFELNILAEAVQADNNGTTAREGFAVYPAQP